jgi:predicted ATP-dependent endonuclease of OLD family
MSEEKISVKESFDPKQLDENGEIKIKTRKPRAPRSVVGDVDENGKKLISTANAAMKKRAASMPAAEKTRIINELAEEDYKKFASILISELLGASVTTLNSRISDLESAISKAPLKILDHSAKAAAQDALQEAANIVQKQKEEPEEQEEPVKPKRIVKKKEATKKKAPEPEPETESEEEFSV